MNPTDIEYATHGIHPIRGCSHGCPGCWAKGTLRRFSRGCPDCAAFRVHLHRAELGKFGGPKTKPKTVVMDFLGDRWDVAVPQEWRDLEYECMDLAPQHRYLLLTKQPQNITAQDRVGLDALQDAGIVPWLGVSASHFQVGEQRTTELRCAAYLWPRLWLSLEPLQEQLTTWSVHRLLFGCHWLVVGPQTPLRTARVLPPLEWYETIRDACRERGVPVWFKNAARKQYPAADLPQETPWNREVLHDPT